MKAIPFLIPIAGAIVFFLIGTGIYPGARRLARWSRYTCIVLSLMIASYGALHYVLKFERAALSADAFWRVDHYFMWIGGMIIGSFFTVLASGEFFKIRKPTSTRPPPPA